MSHRSYFAVVLSGLLLVLAATPSEAAILAVTYDGDVVRIDETSGDNTLVGWSGFDRLNGLTRDGSGRYFAITQEGTIIEINPETGAGTFVLSVPMPSPVHIVRTLAASPSGELYWASGSLYEASPDTLEKYNPATGEVTSIAVLEEVDSGVSVSALTGLTFAEDGRLMGWDQLSWGLMEIDPATAQAVDTGGIGWPTVNIETLAYTLDGDLRGIGGYGRDGSDNLYEIDDRGGALSHVRIGALDIRGMEYETDEGGEDPPPDDPPPFRMPERRPPAQPEVIYNLFLVDCGPCPHCFERPCDPRVNPELDSFLIWDPLRDVVASFSRKTLGLQDKDGPITAAAPLHDWGKQDVFVISLPYADNGAGKAGSVLFFDRSGKTVKRFDGQRAGERFGVMMDVWADEVVVASADRLVRLRRGEVVHEQSWTRGLGSQGGVRVAFTRDMDGDRRPEVMLGMPYVRVGKLNNAGQIQVIGSHNGTILDIQSGRFAGQRLGLSLQPIAQTGRVRPGK